MTGSAIPLGIPGILLRTYGLKGLVRRSLHELRRRSGRFRHSPRHGGGSPTPGEVYRVRPDVLAEAVSYSGLDAGELVASARRVAAGAYRAFGGAWAVLPTGAAWHLHDGSGHRFPSAGPWWRVSHLASYADIKEVWEPARFGWVHDLVTGFLLTGDPGLSEAFHRHLEDWIEANPPFQGVHWSCGQETAIRALALLHAEANLPAPEPAAARRLSDLLAASAERIDDGIGYALSQRNNHGISESAGLVHLGLRFRGHHPEAEGWAQRGRRLLEAQILDQFADDGWYIQHSFTYLRIALEQALLARRALRFAGWDLGAGALERLRQGARLLAEVVDAESGEAPNHGANDGAWLLPLGGAAYRDMRPTLTLAALELGLPLPADLAPDPVMTGWMGGEVPRSPARSDGVARGASGWASVRRGRVQAFLRAGHYTSRPSHLDALHLDVRIDGREVVVDPGTFAYNDPPPWRNPLVTARVHNGPLVDDREPALRGPRFLWYSWPEAHLLRGEARRDRSILEAEVPGAAHRRVVITDDSLEIEDLLLAEGEHALTARWTLPPGVSPDRLATEPLPRVRPAREGSIEGWVSTGYRRREAGCVVEVSERGSRGTILMTRISAPALEPPGERGVGREAGRRPAAREAP